MSIPIKYSHNGEDFIVYPEYTNFSVSDYTALAEKTTATIIGGTKETFHMYKYEKEKWIQAIMVRNKPHMLGFRSKTHLTSFEKKDGFVEAPPKNGYPIWDTDHNKVLVIICYEICFPEDYYHLVDKDIDMIVHLVGFPMYDKNQYKAWYALQKAVVKHFNVPLVSSCGGKGMNRFTHIITPELLNEKVDLMGNYTIGDR